jgi:hypothetical protein
LAKSKRLLCRFFFLTSGHGTKKIVKNKYFLKILPSLHRYWPPIGLYQAIFCIIIHF